jgi:hypothetical protein
MKLRYLSTILLSFFLAVLPLNNSFSASKSSFGGSRSSSTSKSTAPKSSFSSPSKSSGWGSSTTPSAPATSSPSRSSFGSPSSTPSNPSAPATSSSSSFGSWFGGKKSSPATNNASNTDKALSAKTAANSNTKSRETLVNEFKAQNAAKYTNTFKSEPASRPSYIPQSKQFDGVERPITYNVNTGNYGYWNALGTFMVYDALTDAAHNHATTVHHTYGPAQASSGGSAIGTVLTVILFLAIGAGIIGLIFWKFFSR